MWNERYEINNVNINNSESEEILMKTSIIENEREK
jgi:hypothetical protein